MILNYLCVPKPAYSNCGSPVLTTVQNTFNLFGSELCININHMMIIVRVIRLNVALTLFLCNHPINIPFAVVQDLDTLNPLNAELNSICHLLALLVHHFLHVSRIRVKSLTLRLLMSYVYIWSTHS